MSGYAGFADPQDTGSDFSGMSFLVQMLVNRVATVTIGSIVAVTTADAVAPVGFVDLNPMVNQVDGDGNPTPHGTIHNVPYFRIQGGKNAVIIDPEVNDIGIVLFCSRDITGVKRTKAVANPGSKRVYDWADALYIGGILNGVPQQWVRFSPTGIELSSPQNVTITAPTTTINSATTINGVTTINGNVATTGTLVNNAHNVGSTHQHSSSGGTGVGGPPL